MRIDVLARTILADHQLLTAYDYNAYEGFGDDDSFGPGSADALSEAAGRICYKSFNRPNPATASNRGYLTNILAQGHYSVLEHSSVTFLARGVSRSLLAELSRHRHLSFSVVSQRYVDYAETAPVIPPGADAEAEQMIRSDYAATMLVYKDLYARLVSNGLKRKAAREAARSVLPNTAPVDMVVTGNLRAWRDVLGKRWHVAADAEICEFAGLVLGHLRRIAPNSTQDIPAEPYGTESDA